MAVADPNAPPAATPELLHRLDVLEVLRKYPKADETILSAVGGDRTTIEATAKRLQEMAIAAETPPAAPPTTTTTSPPQPPAPGSTPTPAAIAPTPATPMPTPGPGIAQPPEHVEEAHYEELKFKVENKIATEFERQEFFTLSFRGPWNDHVAKLNARPGRS